MAHALAVDFLRDGGKRQRHADAICPGRTDLVGTDAVGDDQSGPNGLR